MNALPAVEDFFREFIRLDGTVALSDCASGKDFSYALLEELSSKVAARFSRFAGPGTRVALLLPNSAEMILSYLACFRLGAVSIPINTSFSKDEIAGILELASPEAVITHHSVAGSLPPGTQAVIWGEGELTLDGALAGPRLAAERDSRSPDDALAHIVFSSGTTGAPKAIPIRFGAILKHSKSFARSHALDSNCRFYNVLPLAYLGGWYNLALVPFQAGGTVVLDREFGMGGIYRFWAACFEKRVNCVWFTPSMLSALAAVGVEDESQREAISKAIRWAMVGMAPLPPSLKEKFEMVFGVRLQQSYGLSETLLFTSWRNELESPPSSVGRPLDGYEVRIGEGGEVQVKGEWVSTGYWNQPDLTARAFGPDGYFKTGDLGRFDEAGRLYITGRIKDLIIRGGVNISPAEIENMVLKLRGVREVAVIGVEDELYGEKIVLFATVEKAGEGEVPGPGPSEIIAHCRAHLSSSKVPSAVHLLESMPLNASGKIQKGELRRLLPHGRG